MATQETLDKVKQSIRRRHDKLDADLMGDIEACLADLRVCGVTHAPETDPLIYRAIKLYCLAANTDDPAKSAKYQQGYDALKATLMMAEGYGWRAEV